MKTEDLQNITEKYKIWNTETNTWYRPTYPKNKVLNTEEILFSQSGEMWMRTNDGQPGSCDILTHLNGKFKPCLYTGLKDINEIKTYANDVVLCKGRKGIVVIKNGTAWIDFHVFDSSSPILRHFLGDETFENLGSVFEHPELLES